LAATQPCTKIDNKTIILLYKIINTQAFFPLTMTLSLITENNLGDSRQVFRNNTQGTHHSLFKSKDFTPFYVTPSCLNSAQFYNFLGDHLARTRQIDRLKPNMKIQQLKPKKVSRD
jgi:hypothetical protein